MQISVLQLTISMLPKGKTTVFCAKAEAVGRDSFCVETPLVVGPRAGGRSGHQAFAGLLVQGCPACASDCVDCPVHATRTEAERAYAGMPGRLPEETDKITLTKEKSRLVFYRKPQKHTFFMP